MLNKLTPNLMVEDVNQTLEFYRQVLGFEVLATVPEQGVFDWAMVKEGDVELMFQTRESLTQEIPAFAGATIGGSLTFYTDVVDIQNLYDRLRDKVEVVEELHTTFYQRKEFSCRDCNGYFLAFSQGE